MQNKTPKHDQHVKNVKSLVASIDIEEKVIKVYSTNEDMLKVNNNQDVKTLVKMYGYHIQTIIK